MRAILPYRGKITQIPMFLRLRLMENYTNWPGRMGGGWCIKRWGISRYGWGTPHPSLVRWLVPKVPMYKPASTSKFDCAVGLMSFLVRTAVGPYKISDSLTLEEITIMSKENTLLEKIISIEQALCALPAVRVKNGAVRAVLSGAKLYPPGVAGLPGRLNEGDKVRLVGPQGLLAMAETTCDNGI